MYEEANHQTRSHELEEVSFMGEEHTAQGTGGSKRPTGVTVGN